MLNMSWETLVVGNFRFKKGDRELKKKIIDEIETAIECKVKYDRKWHEYVFQDVNWSSHVKGENIKKVVEKYQNWFVYFNASVFYLGESDESIVFDGGELNADVMEML